MPCSMGIRATEIICREVMMKNGLPRRPSYGSLSQAAVKPQAHITRQAPPFTACGLDTNEFFDREDFADIVNFNTPATINAIGVATSDIAEMALREISQSIRNVQIAEKDQNRTFAQKTQAQYDKGRQQPERSEYNERNHLQQTGGLSYSRPNITDRARASAWQVRFDAQGLSGEAQASDLSQSADIGQAERASARGRADSTPEVGASDEAALSRAGRDRGTERESTDAVGRTDEQHPQPSGGSDTDRTDLQVSVAKEDEVRVNLPTVDEQIEMIAKAEDEKASAFAISKEDIDSVLQKGSGVADGKYRIYRQFQKGVDRQKNIEFLKNEYGTGGGTHIFPDGFSGHSWHDSKGLAIDRNGTYTNHDLVLKWSQVEKRLRELIKDNRYLNPKEKDHYADYLESVSAPQYEIDTQRKIARQRFIDAHRDLPPADKRDTLALRLSDFIRDLDRYEKDLLSVVERSDLADVTAEQMEQHLSDPSTVQQLIDFLAQVQWKTTSVFSRSNGWKFTEELRELHPLCYLYNEGDVVYIGADKYEIATLTEEKVYLQNAEFPILGQEYSRADFEEKLTENPANDHLKVVVTEKQRTEAPSEKKQDGIQFSIGFSEHPAFYDRQLNDRYTDLSFALGNKLLGILDEKQHREREGDKNIGWYHKTDFVIKAVIGGEEFNYEGRFDIGDGEGDLIAHIKNFYDYALSPKGEQLYGDDRESLLRGRDEFIPFLEQHTELKPEDEKLLDEIMATESDWYRTAEEAEEKPQANADKVNGSEAPVIEMEQSTDDLIGREIIIDNRKYLIESIGKISGDVSLRDITFQNNVGFPINRVEKIGYIQKLLEQEKTELPPEEKTEAPATDRHNFRITDDAIGIGGAKEKFRNNMAAINLLHELEIENRLATPEEQEVLSRYVGWGGLSMAFDEHNAAWAEEFKELYASLSPEEYRAAMESTLTAFYTPPVVIKAMYDVLDRLGFSQGNILEPSCGTGNFFGLLPESMQNSKLHGVEIDSLTGRIAKQLYQKANIAIEGFEKTNLPDDHFDVVLGNVPFGEIRVNDSRYNAQKFLIHDYFFAKALDKVRAGGVVMFITSKGTMDKASPEVRKYIAQRAELLGAIRLPDNTFKANAGTEVTSDILILQKRDRVMDIEPDWVHLDTDENGVTMNRYFVEHPEMVLGEIKMENTRFGTFEPVCKARKDIPLSELLSNAVQRINGEIPELDNRVDEISDEQELSVPADPNVRNFSFTLVDGRVYFRENDRMQPASVSMTAENRIKGLIQIRDCVRKLIEYQTDDYPEEMIRTEQENLNRLYDVYTAKYGLINSRGNYLAFASDESYFLLCSLEVLDDEGNFKRKADMFTKRTIKPHREVTSVETASEALALSIGEKARVDLPYMEQLTGKTQAELVQDLQGVIFKVPNCEHVSYVAADEYLSGNVRNKLTVADLAAKNDSELAVNVEALEKVIPKDLSAAEISVRLGATWIPQEDIQRFVMELLTPSSYAAGRLKVRYTPINGDWFIENKSSDMGNVKADSTYGTKRASAYRIIEDTLNLRDTRIFDYVYDEHGNKKAVFNAKETTAAQAKQEVIKQAFQDWIWKDPERRNRLVRYYNDTFNSVRPREYDGSHITFGGISPEITLRPHQVNAIAHILYGGNTLLAHKVGAGKTFEMVAAAQENKRLGLCQKSMFVVPNHLVGQWASEYLRLYPSANILVTTKRDFETGNRKKFCGRIATGDYDAVIIGHSQFEKIPMSIGRQREQLENWEEHADTKATQLVFCDLSTPKNDGTFNVYDDMREKLIARGIPAEQIRFIHEATTDAQKKELFGKVRSGEVRVLFGSTPKMGAGTNVQDRLIAIHNLDCPWRPSDLEQRQGRIERQGNMFPEVEVYRYVTEQTFDAYLYQLVESKQKFISQIMTSKSPVRSAEDVDEVALSFAEVKMLATGDARFKEKMDLDIQVSKLRVLKQSYLSEHYDLEDRVLKYYPQTIKEYEERIAGYENDAALVEQHKPQGEDKFCPMTLKGMTYTEKADAGEMLLAICKDYPMSAATEIGSYRGFRIEIYYDTVNAHYCMNLCGKAKHKVDLGADALGNLTRIENELSKLPARLEAAKTKKAETIAQLETAKEEIKKPFAFEDELKEKTERLNALNIELNLNEKDTSVMDTEPEQAEEQPERKCASRER